MNDEDLRKSLQESRRAREQERIASDPLLALYGSGKDLWADEHADQYVARLRAGWDEDPLSP
ncbi:MAG: hypothetical protein WA510_29260 [Acidobacteriaceae bacterium]